MIKAPKQIALVIQTRIYENNSILQGIAAFERQNAAWNFFLDDQARSVNNPAWLLRKKWDGLICRHRYPTIVEEFHRLGIPCVNIDDTEWSKPGVPKVRPDNRAMGHLAAEHFLERGFRHFAFSGFSNEDWSLERRDSFKESIQAMGYECHLFESFYPNEVNPEWDQEEQESLKKWLKSLPYPIGIMTCNDMRGLQLIHAAQEAGLKVPEEVAILGANNDVVRAELSNPPLSSIPVNSYEWGFQAASVLNDMIEGKEVPEDTFIEPLNVIVRRSTDALAIEDPTVVKALKIIQQEACAGLRVDDLVKRVSVSRSLLERRFRKVLRRTPQEEIRHARINRMKGLLSDTDKTLADIAEIVGFEHPEYCSVMFKRLTGESPSEYRQRHRAIHRA
ncbi:MAG: LacI family transcriptional regulator [Puniceicoccaceae bacterium 5H]|nr:MAG: LacI family transcriptional regulator [Puniceicoccaceae bacterium 5H]